MHLSGRSESQALDESVPDWGAKRTARRALVTAAVVLVRAVGGMLRQKGDEIDVASASRGEMNPACAIARVCGEHDGVSQTCAPCLRDERMDLTCRVKQNQRDPVANDWSDFFRPVELSFDFRTRSLKCCDLRVPT